MNNKERHEVAAPIFKAQTHRVPITQSGSRGVVTGVGSKLYAFGREIENLSSFTYKTSVSVDGVLTTQMTIDIAEAIEVEFIDEGFAVKPHE